jgi:iron complex outermembrane receptor protein
VIPITPLARLSAFAVRRRTETLSTSLLALMCAVTATNVAAQEPVAEELEEITVTGSRIARDGIASPTPVTVIGAQRLADLGSPNIGQLLNTLPSFRATSGPQTANIQPRNAGLVLADLRGLGTARTLVLVDGRRFMPSTQEGNVDLNQIPTLLIDRTEIVTGGASAAYGSDAVAGVVNLILKSDLDGIRTQLQYGQTEEGDGENLLAGFAMGTPFAGDRGHVTFALEYEDNKGVGDCYTRDWCREEYQVVGNVGGNLTALPANLILPRTHNLSAVPGGIILAQGGFVPDAAAPGGSRSLNPPGATAFTPFPLAGVAFNADGTPRQFQFGDRYGAAANPQTFMVGGEGYNGYIGAPLIVVPVERYNAFLKSEFTLTDNLEGFFEGSFGHTKSEGRGAQTRDPAPTNITIRGDNPFIPTALRTSLLNAGLTTDSRTAFLLGRMGDDFGPTKNLVENDTYRAMAGLKGSLTGSWTWDAYYQYGASSYDQEVRNNRIQQLVPGVAQLGNAPVRIQLAADVTTNPANGQPICRSTLTNPGNGCVPVNLFGLNNFSQAARDWLYGTSNLAVDLTQHVVAASMQGDLFDTWAGTVPLAFGAEYRTNKVETNADPISRTSGFYVFNAPDVEGEIKVKEAFLETVVPIARDLPGARLIELNGAVRVTDYDISGDVTTWKYGVVYEPLDGLRFRATQSRDIRAPNLDELYRPQTTATQTILGSLTRSITGGNTALVPEEADTFTVGVTFSMLDGIRASVDYFDIEIENVITTLSGATVVTRCRTIGAYCDQVDFLNPADRSSPPVETRTLFQNLNSLEVSGFDFELGYNLPIGDSSFDFTLLATRMVHLTTTDVTGTQVDRAGVTGNNVSGGGAGMPEWQANGLITFAHGPASVTLETRFIDSGKFDSTLIGPDDPRYAAALTSPTLRNSTINRNEVASVVYFNLGGTYKFTGFKETEMELFAGVQNLLDRDPPVAPSNQGSSNLILFDPLGRAYRLGVRANF